MLLIRDPWARCVFPTWERFVPNVGMSRSQRGNNPFPSWEHLASLLGAHPKPPPDFSGNLVETWWKVSEDLVEC